MGFERQAVIGQLDEIEKVQMARGKGCGKTRITEGTGCV